MPQRLRVFVSSPGDVPDERLRADLVIDKLSQDYSRFFSIASYRWEHEPMLASGHFQDAIEPPSAFDIVVLIVWSRLGTPLPQKTAMREYRGIDGRAPVTGTEWEYEEALRAARQNGAPDLLAFRNVSSTPINPRDPDARARSLAQIDALDAFWKRHFADRGMFLAAYDEYRTLEEFAQRLEDSLRKLVERRIKALAAGADLRAEPIWLGAPFRGLEPYEFEHAPIFFGRDAAVTKATEQLAVNARSGVAFLLVSGASGSGKSSLAKAAVLPRLMKPQRIEGLAFLRRAVFRPGDSGRDIILGLVDALTRVGEAGVGIPELLGPGQTAAQLAEHLRLSADGPGFVFAGALGRLTEAGRKSGHLLAFEDAKLILLIDQLEEIFTVHRIDAEERRLFVRLLSGLARSGAMWVIATLRADFWHRAAEIPDLIALAEGPRRLDIAAPSPAEVAEMIRKPAQAAGLSFEVHADTGLGLDAVLAEHASAAPGVLPLLSFTLDELYARDVEARGATVLTHASYAALGGLEGAIAKRGDEIVASLPATAQTALPRVLRALTTVSGGTDQLPVTRSAPLASFPEGSPARILVDALTSARLLVATSEGSVPCVRLAHEALISRWRRASDQLALDRRDLETRALVERQLERWRKASGRAQRQLLLRDPDLANAIDLARRWGDELDAPTRGFIEASRSRARLRQQLTAAAAGAFALVAIAASALGVIAEHQRNLAEQQTLEAERQRQAAEGQRARAEQETLEAERQRHAAEEQRARAEQQRAEAQRQRQVAQEQRAQAEQERARAESNLARAEQERQRAESNLTLARRAQSQYLASLSVQRNEDWDAGAAALLGLEALPDLHGAVERPYAPEAELALFNGIRDLLEVAVLKGHRSELVGADFSPDGRRVVAASSDKTARIWDAASGNQIALLDGHEDTVWSAAFSPDGQRVVTASSDKTARIWDAASGQQIAILAGHEDSVNMAVFSPDGRRVVTASTDNTARFWDAANGQQIAVLKGHHNTVYRATFSPDGRRVATASYDGRARIWDAASGKQIALLDGHEDPVYSAAFSPDGRRVVTASGDNTARIWDAGSGKQIAVLKGYHVNTIYRATFSPDGRRVVTASYDNNAAVWDAASGKQVSTFNRHDREVESVAFSSDGRRVLTASRDKTARIWDAATGEEIAIFSGHDDAVVSAAFSPDGQRVLTASKDGTARIWHTAIGNDVPVLRGHEGTVWRADFSPDAERVVTASDERRARVWDATSGKQIAILDGHEDVVVSAVFSPDGRVVLTASRDHTARIWDGASGKQIAVLRGHKDPVNMAVFSPDGRRVATASVDQTARIWEAASGKQIAVLTGHEDSVLAAAFAPDGLRVVTVSSSGFRWKSLPTDNTARIWDAATGKQIAVLTGHEKPVNTAVFSPDGSRVVTASEDQTARVWEAASGKQIVVLKGHKDNVRSATFSPDGARVVTASDDDTARIWDAESGNQIAVLDGHDDEVWSAVFSPDGHRIVTGSKDRTARIWDSASGKPIGVLNGHDDVVRSVAFARDSRRVVTASDDKTARIWRAFPATQELIDYAKARVPRCLSRKQREDALLDHEPPAWCIEMEKWPYHAKDWKEWLKFKRSNANPPLPDSAEWRSWIAAH